MKCAYNAQFSKSKVQPKNTKQKQSNQGQCKNLEWNEVP